MIVYGLDFLKKEPKYLCLQSNGNTGVWVSCPKDDICNPKLGYTKDMWKIDYSQPETYFNWYDPSQLDLTCVEKTTIGLIGSIYFFGFAGSAAIYPILADRFGRKIPYLVGLGI